LQTRVGATFKLVEEPTSMIVKQGGGGGAGGNALVDIPMNGAFRNILILVTGSLYYLNMIST
jgi:hypothetical protein